MTRRLTHRQIPCEYCGAKEDEPCVIVTPRFQRTRPVSWYTHYHHAARQHHE